MATAEQRMAEAEFAPKRMEKQSQQKRILETIREQGFITKWGAIYDVRLHCSKLSTRIGEIEIKSGHRFDRERLYHTDSTGKRYFLGLKYTLPKGLTIDDFKV